VPPTLAIGTQSGEVELRQLIGTIWKSRRVTNHKSTVGGLAFSADGRFLTSGGTSAGDTADPIRTAAIDTQQTDTAIDINRGGFVFGLALSPNGRFLAMALPDQGVLLRDLHGRERPQWLWPGGNARTVAFDVSGERISAAGGHDVLVWRLSDQQLTAQFSLGIDEGSRVEKVDFMDGLAADSDGAVTIWNLDLDVQLARARALAGSGVLASAGLSKLSTRQHCQPPVL
jgi:WD40 repeat protein